MYVFHITPPPSSIQMLSWISLALVPVAILLFIIGFLERKGIHLPFVNMPSSLGPRGRFWLSIAIGLILLILSGYLYLSISPSAGTEVIVRKDGLQIRDIAYGKFIPKDSLIISKARIIDLNAEKGYRPSIRDWGTSLPGYSAGWFTLQNGEKALVFLCNHTRIVYIPTKEGYSILLDLANPDKFLEVLKKELG